MGSRSHSDCILVRGASWFRGGEVVPLTLHFLNVGRGDCTIIEFPSGRVGMVDIANLKVLDPDTRAELTQEIRESSAYKIAKAHDYNLSAVEAVLLKRAEEQLTDP